MPDAYIFDSVRTPRGKGRPSGALHTLSPIDLGATVLAALDERTRFSRFEPEDVIFGCGDGVNDQGANIARSSVLHAGLPDTIAGSTVSRFCASGLDAVNSAAARVMAGQAELIVAGGVEMMSIIPIAGTGGPNGTDAIFNDEAHFTPLGEAADLLATLCGHSRADADAYAAASQGRAADAWNERRFDRSIVPVHDVNGTLMLDRDEHVRPGTTVEDLAKLPAAFRAMGEKGGFDAIVRQRYPQVAKVAHVHTAGNSSGIVDGAAAMLVGTAEAGERLGLKPRARIRSFANAAMDPCLMLAAPADATRRCLSRAGRTLDDIDLYEVNEAFGSVPLAWAKAVGADPAKLNVNGGAQANGHPLGCTGAKLMTTLLNELERRKGRYGLLAICEDGGTANATIIERLES